jgi:hypothetical protein
MNAIPIILGEISEVDPFGFIGLILLVSCFVLGPAIIREIVDADGHGIFICAIAFVAGIIFCFLHWWWLAGICGILFVAIIAKS